jgi:ATP-dependent RNA helicase MSS116
MAGFEAYGVHPATLRALRDVFGYARPSPPQAQSLAAALAGADVFVRAGTGSGKTLSFLIPLAQALAGPGTAGTAGIGAVVLSPSRELAHQTAAEAEKLLRFHAGLCVRTAVGGSKVARERAQLRAADCRVVLVATPGRLLDHLEHDADVAARLRSDVRVLVLDEADRLLDQGFRAALKKIAAALPPARDRQTLLFTATTPPGVEAVAAEFMRPGFRRIDVTTPDGADGAERAALDRIRQAVLVMPPAALLPALYDLLRERMAADPAHKIIVFVATGTLAHFVAELLRAAGMPGTGEMHARLAQNKRDEQTRGFRAARSGVIVASDVIARGLDFPDVTTVLQVGPTNEEQYQHRVGRTGRAGKTGEALLLLGWDEAPGALRMLGAAVRARLRLHELAREAADAREPPRSTAPALLAAMRGLEADPRLRSAAQAAFKGTLGFYSGQKGRDRLGWTPAQVVDAVRLRFSSAGLVSFPRVSAATMDKMGLKGVGDLPGVGAPRGRSSRRPRSSRRAFRRQ